MLRLTRVSPVFGHSAFQSPAVRRFGLRATPVVRKAQPLTHHPSPVWSNPDPTSQFIVDGRRGFLPTQDPLTALPERFGVLEDLLQRMPLKLPDGSAGLLGQGRLGAAVDQELPVYDVSRETDPRLLTALFRDLTFLASAYLLEPCDRLYRQTGEYGLGRNVLPRAIAQPLEVVAAKIGAMPFMEYAQSYSLYNYRLRDPSQGLDYNNLDLVRQFSGCPSEHGFILVHVAMVAHTGPLVSSALGVLQGVRDQDRTAFNASLELYRDTMDKINQVMETMWKRSRAEDYMSFRTFIMGTKNQPMFPNGITFEGTPAQSNPRFYRGESGANDSIIPTSDNLFQLTAHMPNNPLTQTLRDFRNYRPKNHHGFVTHMENEANHLRVRDFALRDPQSTALYLENLDWIRAFRHRHWMFTKEYIIKYTSHPVATGGSPIVTWLPNQLSTVLNAINEVSAKLPLSALSGNYRQHIEEIIGRADSQKRVLQREVRELQVRFPNQERFQI